MSNKIKIAPSILSADFSKLGEEIKNVVKAGADWIHIDVMDGVFVPNITIGPCVIRSVRNMTNIPLDVHLMIENPYAHIESFAKAGSDIITFHIESSKEPKKTIERIRSFKKMAGVSIRPRTPLEALSGILNEIDMVLIMTVEPGFAGQEFIKDVVPKITELRKIFARDIQVDGGIDENTAKIAIKAGANILVAGTAVFGKKEYREAIERLRG